MKVEPLALSFHLTEAQIDAQIRKEEAAIAADQNNPKALEIDEICLEISKLGKDSLLHPEHKAANDAKIAALNQEIREIDPNHTIHRDFSPF